MKHSTLKNIVLPGIFCAACLGASVWYSVVFNHSRLIAPTDFSTYASGSTRRPGKFFPLRSFCSLAFSGSFLRAKCPTR